VRADVRTDAQRTPQIPLWPVGRTRHAHCPAEASGNKGVSMSGRDSKRRRIDGEANAVGIVNHDAPQDLQGGNQFQLQMMHAQQAAPPPPNLLGLAVDPLLAAPQLAQDQPQHQQPAPADQAAPLAPPDARTALELLQAIAVKVHAQAEELILDGTDDDRVCWNLALHGCPDHDVVDPALEMEGEARKRPDIFQDRADGSLGPKGGKKGKAREWHHGMAKQLAQGIGWTLQDDSPLQIYYQFKNTTAVYTHWELWFNDPGGQGRTAIAKFAPGPIHAKSTEPVLGFGEERYCFGVSVDSVPAMVTERLRGLADSDSYGRVYGEP
jgi:hypothetical protein